MNKTHQIIIFSSSLQYSKVHLLCEDDWGQTSIMHSTLTGLAGIAKTITKHNFIIAKLGPTYNFSSALSKNLVVQKLCCPKITLSKNCVVQKLLCPKIAYGMVYVPVKQYIKVTGINN